MKINFHADATIPGTSNIINGDFSLTMLEVVSYSEQFATRNKVENRNGFIQAFEDAWLSFLKGSHSDLLDAIRTEGELSAANEAKLGDLCDNMVSNFAG